MIEQVILQQPLGTAIRQLVPQWLVPFFLFVTRLGNIAVFLVLFAIDYWFFDHERGAHAIALIIGGMALIAALKAFFGVPRPPAEVNVIPIDGLSFPSGHAMGATIAYGTLAYDLKIGSKRLRYGVASVLIVLISLSRVVLGVHFVEDIVAGMLFGVGFLSTAFLLTEHHPREGFALAVVIGAVAFVVTGASADGVAVLGSALGAAVSWEYFDDVPSVDLRAAKLVLVAVVLPVLAGIGYLSVRGGYSLPVVFVLNVVLMVGLIGAPVLENPFERMEATGQPQSQ